MSLDINTPKGKKSLSQEQEMLSIIEKAFPGVSAIQTPKERESVIDGAIVKGQSICALFESKCRDMTHEQLGQYDNEWMVTFEKIKKGAEVAKSFCVPYVGYLYLVPEKKVLAVKIADDKGNFLQKMRIERTETKKTINGGFIVRTNAFIDMTDAKEFS